MKPEQVSENEIMIIEDDAKHIVTVLRGKTGDTITVCDGAGIDYKCKLSFVKSDMVKAEIVEKIENDVEPKTKITLFQGLPKVDKFETVIQKCVELGVSEVVPVAMERSVVKLTSKEKEKKKIERWEKISESAAKQSGRGKIPKINEILSFSQALEKAKEYDAVLIPYENEQKTGLKEFVQEFKGDSIAVFIGPEGGFSDEEYGKAIEMGAVSVTLGKRILRTETAGMTVLAILFYELG